MARRESPRKKKTGLCIHTSDSARNPPFAEHNGKGCPFLVQVWKLEGILLFVQPKATMVHDGYNYIVCRINKRNKGQFPYPFCMHKYAYNTIYYAIQAGQGKGYILQPAGFGRVNIMDGDKNKRG
jgi:hypothetical protein